MLLRLLLGLAHAGPAVVTPPLLPGERVQIDGRLDEPVWARAAVVDDFLRWRPVPGGPAPGRTEARIWYDEERIYFGFVCEDPEPDRLRAHVMPREDINSDDQIGITLDTFSDQRSAFTFWVNALGVQQDYRETVSLGPNFAWDAVWSSRGVRTERGYTVEVAIPWKSLWYPHQPEQGWGLVLQRKIPAENAYYAWPELDHDKASALLQAGRMEGLKPPSRALRLDLMPTLTAGRSWLREEGQEHLAPQEVGSWTDVVSPGLDLRWGPTPDLALDGTLNPDFSQIEADPFQMELNNRFALYLDEQRPFFLSGVDAYEDPSDTLYTRSIVAPIGGLKLTGRRGQGTVGALLAWDRSPEPSLVSECGTRSGCETPGFGADAVDGAHAVNSVLRLKRDLGETWQAGGIAARKDLIDPDTLRPTASNTVLGLDVNGTFADRLASSAQVRGSATGETGEAQMLGGSAYGVLQRKGQSGWGGVLLEVDHVSQDFRAETDFQTRTGTTGFGTYQRYRVELGERSWIQPGVEGWLNLVHGSELGPESWVGLNLTNQIGPSVELAASAGRGTELYGDTLQPYVFGWMDLGAAPSGWLELGVEVEGGGTIDYSTGEPANLLSAAGGVLLKPLPGVQVQVEAERQDLWAREDGAHLGWSDILRAEANAQFTRALGLRGLVQGRAEGDVGGESTARALQVSALLSWLPSPGTALWLGVSEARAAQQDGALEPDERSVFAKASWLFRP